jgi:hypothetical protein
MKKIRLAAMTLFLLFLCMNNTAFAQVPSPTPYCDPIVCPSQTAPPAPEYDRLDMLKYWLDLYFYYLQMGPDTLINSITDIEFC